MSAIFDNRDISVAELEALGYTVTLVPKEVA